MHTLRLFADIARDRSFSRAAERHDISQSAASQRIHALEARLGVTLIDRSVRPLALTPAGETYLAGVQDVLGRLDRLELQVARMGEQASGTVRVASIYSAGIDLLDHVLDQLASNCPAVKVELTYNHIEDVYQSVLENQCDLGIVSYPQRWRKVGVTPLRDEIMVLVCSASHPLADEARVSARDLGDWPLVTFDASQPVGRRIRQYLKEQGVDPQIEHLFDNIDTVKAAVTSGQRVSILPLRTVRREVQAGTLAAVPLKPDLFRPIGIIHQSASSAALPLAAKRFIDHLTRFAGPESETDSVPTPASNGSAFVGGSA